MWAYQLKLPTDILVCDRKACGRYNGRNSYGRNGSALFLFRSQGNSDLGSRPAALGHFKQVGASRQRRSLSIWPNMTWNRPKSGRKLLSQPKISFTAENLSYGQNFGFDCISAFYKESLRFWCCGKNPVSVAHYSMARNVMHQFYWFDSFFHTTL